MPYAKKTGSRKRTVRKPFKKPMATNKTSNNKDFRFKQSNAYNVKPEPFPRTLLTRCKYANNGTLSTTLLDTAVSNSYRANSIWDPDFTGIGTTVVGQSILANIYGMYQPLGCKVTLTFNDPTADGSRVGFRLRCAQNGATSLSTLNQLMQQPMTYVSGINNSGSQKKSFNFYIKPWSLAGVTKLEYMANSSLYNAATNTTPTIPIYFDVFHINSNGACNINYAIKIVYYVRFYNRLYLSPSIV